MIHQAQQVLNAQPTTAGEAHGAVQGAHRRLELCGEVLSQSDLAYVLGKTTRTIRNWAKVGDGPKRLAVSGRPAYSRLCVLAWLEGR